MKVTAKTNQEHLSTHRNNTKSFLPLSTLFSYRIAVQVAQTWTFDTQWDVAYKNFEKYPFLELKDQNLMPRKVILKYQQFYTF
jgi:hypothetical protein